MTGTVISWQMVGAMSKTDVILKLLFHRALTVAVSIGGKKRICERKHIKTGTSKMMVAD